MANTGALKLSIIIPVLNEEAGLSRLNSHLQAIRNQGHEVIIVDGGSRDNTLALAYELADHVIVSKVGRAVQMNNGAAIANGDVFVFLHADTFLPDDAVQIICTAMTGNCWGRFNVRLSSKRFVFRIIERFINLRSCLTSIVTGDQAMFIERSLFESVAGFPEIALMEDVEMSRRLKKTGRPICIKQKATTSSRRWENKGVVATVLLMWKLRLYYFFGMSPDKLNRLYRHVSP
jgi:rSAM/selenodomain-associated transferase 2